MFYLWLIIDYARLHGSVLLKLPAGLLCEEFLFIVSLIEVSYLIIAQTRSVAPSNMVFFIAQCLNSF